MSLRDRILRYCGGDSEHAQLVEEALADPALFREQLAAARVTPAGCERCGSILGFEDETGFCAECSHVTPRKKSTERQPSDLSEPRAGAQKGKGYQ